MRRALLLLITLAPGMGACADRTRSAPAGPEVAAPVAAKPEPAELDLDGLIEAMWDEAGVTPAPEVDDAGFLRRVSIDLTGRIPEPEQVRAFLADESPTKREELVDRLLTSEDCAEYWGEVLVDALVPWEYQRLPVYGDAPRGWFVEAMATNRSWREMVTQLLTASGRVHDDGATAYVASNLQGATHEMLTAAVLDDMLGLEEYRCAQCHDHPEREDVLQKDFLGVVAFLSNTRVRNDRRGGVRTLRVEDRPPRPFRPDVAGSVVVEPSFLGEPPRGDTSSPRARLAGRVVADPRFASAFVDRVWVQLFGRKLGPAGARVRQHLAVGLRETDHAIRPLLRRVVLSAAYQRDSRTGPIRATDPLEVFARAPVRPLTAMNLYRAIARATSIDPELPTFLPLRNVDRGTARHQRDFHETFPEASADAATAGTLAQALQLLNGTVVHMAVKARPGSRLQYLFDRYTDDRSRMEELYLTVLGRPPHEDELEADLALVAGAETARRAWEDVLFGMIISTEFLTNH